LNRPSSGIATESVEALEEQTREHERAIIKLKRTRNSLLNISKLPPEVLGNIFYWNVIPRSHLWGWEDRSHTFLLVCHHWFEVASHTPELWSFWGITPAEWKRCYHHSRTTPLDLVLDVDADDGSFDIPLRDALQDRAARDTIRRVHICAEDAKLLSSIVSLLTTNCQEFRSSTLVSFIFLNHGDTSVDLSEFFACYRFPKLQYLELTNYTITCLDHLTSRTGALKILSLDSAPPSPIPTTSQLLSILVSNPTLQQVSTSVRASPGGGDSPSFRVPLHHITNLNLAGDVRNVFEVLRWLDHPEDVDLSFGLQECVVGDISQVIRPYLRDYIGCHGRPQNGLGLFVSQCRDTFEHSLGNVDNLDPATPVGYPVDWFASFEIDLKETLPKDLLEREILDLLAQTPQEDVVSFEVFEEPTAIVEAISTRFQNLRALHLGRTPLSTLTNLGGVEKSFPALRHVCLDQVAVDNYDWGPLTTFLACRMSSGNQLDGLKISGSPHMCTEVVGGIRRLVRHFLIEDPEAHQPCPFNTCPETQSLASPT